MKKMKGIRSIAALMLAVMMTAGHASALTWYINKGRITIVVTVDETTKQKQVVKQGNQEEKDNDPVISSEDPQTASGNTVAIDAEAGTTAQVTFKDLNIDVSEGHTPAVSTSGGGNVEIELDGDSTIISGESAAGLEKENAGELIINDSNETPGSLAATGGGFGAGIGGGQNGNGGDIVINGGTVTATGGGNGAGIGGGCYGSGEAVTINGGIVIATGRQGGAGIGGGFYGNGGDIDINGGTVTATGGEYGAGIGGGCLGAGSNIDIKGDAGVYAASYADGAGIGGGSEGEGSNISVGQSANVSVSGGSGNGYGFDGAAIGNGGKDGVFQPESIVNTDNLYDTGSITIFEMDTPTDKMKGDPPEGTVIKTITTDKHCDNHTPDGTGDCTHLQHCTICGVAIADSYIHTGGEEVRDTVEGNCHTEGYTGDTWCLGCKTKIADGQNTGKVADKHDGDTEVRNVVEGNCHTEGYTGDTYCLGCNVKLFDGENTGKVADSHDGGTEVRDAVEGNCHTEGYTGDTYCLGCGEKLAEGETTGKVADKHDGGTEVRNAVEGNCHTEGYTGDTYCLGCGEKIADGQNTGKVTDKHDGGTEVRNAVDGNCHMEGYSGDTWCLCCEQKIADGQNTGKVADKHDGGTEVRNAVEGNCHTEGYTGDTYCLGCGEKIADGETTGKVADKHDGGTEVRNAAEATCSQEGYTGDTYCLGCGEMIEEGVTIGKKAHTEAADAAVAATCTTAGKTAGSHCSVCGETIVAQTVVAALGHTPAAAVTENEEAAQPGIAGSYDEVVYCGVCGAEVSRTTVTTDPLPEPQHTSARQVTYYTLSFYEDAGAAVQNVKVKAGDVYTLPTPVREGRTFVGWAVSDVPPTDPSWKEPAEGDAGILAGGTKYKATKSVSLVGIWK